MSVQLANGNSVQLAEMAARDSPASDVSRKGSDDVTRGLIGSRLKSDDSPEASPRGSGVIIGRPGDASRI